MTAPENKITGTAKFPPAGGYDRNVRLTVPNYDLLHTQTLRLVKAYFEIQSGSGGKNKKPIRWLDTGGGTGTFAEKIATECPKSEIILADPSAEMLKIARQKFAENINPQAMNAKIQFETVGTQNLTFPDNDFDVMTAVLSHHYLSENERVAATENCFRMLSPGGIYITFEHTAPLTNPGKIVAQQMVADFQKDFGKNKTDVENYKKRYGTEYFPITVAQHMDILKNAGFKTVELFWYSYLDAGFYAIK
ncbi:class I SAM-dependent methyltransferase [Methanolapillus millepedarum]|uniref:2-methoxy-6-polyprenyl-1,4-benzoquinol methylase, mitochondrial n=1 Tax=Methanolapillus millepedarum TaxID=3028296 RepID=A0AA96VFB0_9EURY|nr:2-methoxy-6-polyprenyl-1,4-benzoquinol methylase, mitochondrial [Methanosarcinaceae archaeon Ac7]